MAFASMNDSVTVVEESTPLLSSQPPRGQTHPPSITHHSQSQREDAGRFLTSPASALPIALLSALAMAATAATQIYAYASLLCDDAQHCNDDERAKFAGAVAITTTAANICALFSIRVFQALSKRRNKLGLAIWLLVRSMSVGALSIGGEQGKTEVTRQVMTNHCSIHWQYRYRNVQSGL